MAAMAMGRNSAFLSPTTLSMANLEIRGRGEEMRVTRRVRRMGMLKCLYKRRKKLLFNIKLNEFFIFIYSYKNPTSVCKGHKFCFPF